jgi:hypothetical protein
VTSLMRRLPWQAYQAVGSERNPIRISQKNSRVLLNHSRLRVLYLRLLSTHNFTLRSRSTYHDSNSLKISVIEKSGEFQHQSPREPPSSTHYHSILVQGSGQLKTYISPLPLPLPSSQGAQVRLQAGVPGRARIHLRAQAKYLPPPATKDPNNSLLKSANPKRRICTGEFTSGFSFC